MNANRCIVSQKDTLRRKVLSELKQLAPQDKIQETQVIVSRLLDHARLSSKQSILVYCALSDEVNLNDLSFSWKKKGYKISFPGWKNNIITIYEIQKCVPLSDWTRSEGFLQPNALFSKQIDPSMIDTILVPGRAFTRKGLRLGRGKGYYDRLLKITPQAYKIGIGFSCQLVKKIPQSSHDLAVNEVLTCL